MPGPKAVEIKLNRAAEEALEKLIKGHKTGQQVALRGQIVLKAAQGESNSQIVRDLKVTMNTVKLWRERWALLAEIPLNELSVTERLCDLPRSGNPGHITADQRCLIEKLACESPEQSERPISQWTNQELADEIMKRGIVAQISARHAGRLLKRSGSKTASDPVLADPR